MIDFSRYDCFLFDWDNTLVSTEPMHLEGMRRAMRDLANYEMTYNDCLKFVGSTSRDTASDIFQRLGITQVLPQAITVRKAEILRSMPLEFELYPGALDFLNFWKGRKPMAVASNSPREFVERCMVQSDVKKYFDYVITLTEAPHRKPAPDMFLIAARELGSTPERTLIFEDSETGIRAAQSAGIDCVLVLNPNNPIPPLLPVNMPMHSWPQLLAMAVDKNVNL